MENRPPPRPAPRPAPPRPGPTNKGPAAPAGGSALATVKLSPEQTAELTKQAAAVAAPAPATVAAPATATATAPAPVPAPAFAPAPAPAPASAPAPAPGDRSALETVRLPPEEVATMARPMLNTVPMDPDESARLVEQTRSGVPGEEEPRAEGLRAASAQPKEATITKTLVSAHDDALAAALAAGRAVDVKLAEANEASPGGAVSGDVAALSNTDASSGALRPSARSGDRTFASSEGGTTAGPSAASTARARPLPTSTRWLLPIVAVASFCVVFAIALGFLALRGTFSTRPSAPTSSAAAPSAPTAAPTSPPSVAVTASTAAEPSPSPSEPSQPAPPSPPQEPPPAATSAEAQAREALTRLSDGIAACARDTIGVLPGTSPAVPPATSYLQKGPYTSIPRDWSTPVYSCAKFRLEGPQPFQIQWQVVKPSAEGLGVAWLDENADGKADRALGFRATLKERNQPEMGPIGPLDPMPPVAPPPR